MNYELTTNDIENLFHNEEEDRYVFTLDEYRKLKSADCVLVKVDAHTDLRLLEAWHNSAVEYYSDEIESNPDLNFDVVIGDFEQREQAFDFARDWGFNPRYEHPPTTEVVQAKVYDESQLPKAILDEEKITPANVPSVVSRTQFHVVSKAHREHPKTHIILPRRATKGSAGYDFHSPEDITIQPGETVYIYTDVKCELEDPSLYLGLYIRSNVGIKRKLRLANGTGIIDSDYYENETNDGNIIFAIYNYGTQPVVIHAEERFGQGILQRYYLTSDDAVSDTRSGGVGSTG